MGRLVKGGQEHRLEPVPGKGASLLRQRGASTAGSAFLAGMSFVRVRLFVRFQPFLPKVRPAALTQRDFDRQVFFVSLFLSPNVFFVFLF